MTDPQAVDDGAEGTRTRTSSRKLAILILVLTASTFWVRDGAAEDSVHPLRFSGFGTAGLVHADTSEDWLFARDVSQRGAGSSTSAQPDSRLGLQLNWQLAARWEAVLQAVLRPRVHDARADESLEIGFLAWRPASGWTTRAGRIKPDLFLLHNSRNVGYSMPWVRPSMEFYGWIPSASLDGASVAYDWSDSSATWSTQMWLGEMSNTLAALRTDEAIRWHGRNTVGVTLTRQAGALTLKASFARTQTRLASSPERELLETTLLGVSQLPVGEVADSARELYDYLLPDGTTHYLGAGMEYDTGTWLTTAEVSRTTIERGLTSGYRGYASLGRRFGALTVFATAGFSKPQHAAAEVRGDWVAALTPILGDAEAMGAAMAAGYAATYGTDARFDQRSVGVGLRWDVFDRVALKAQIDRFRVDERGASQWRHSTDESGHVSLFSVAVDWVF